VTGCSAFDNLHFLNLSKCGCLLGEVAAIAWLPSSDPAFLYHRLINPLVRLILAMAVGLVTGSLIEGAGLSRTLTEF
jgi:hypothetical protein